jgi:mono/diheme cytochrome c family protein
MWQLMFFTENQLVKKIIKSLFMLKKSGIVGALLILIYSCGNNSNEKSILALKEDNKLAIAEGLELFERNCISCHSPNASMENRLAPPMIAVKKHYFEEGMTLEDFTKDILAFVKNPSEDKSKMPGALRRFNLMPKMNFSDDQLTKIATYIFFSDIEKPVWFDKHYNEQH